MQGYNPKFLNGIDIELPEFSPALQGDILADAKLRSNIYLDYPNYTIVMNSDKNKKCLFYAAFNIDQNKIIPTKRSNSWRYDGRIPIDAQVGNEYYSDNPWDRGHSIRNATASQGDTKSEASYNARETFYFTNSTLQHENLNQDEWLALEDWVKNLDLDKDGKIIEFTGPFHGQFSRAIRPNGKEAIFTPAGYFKVICFINKKNELETRAFIMYQDEESLKDKSGKNVFDNQTYQVTVAEIEDLTGLKFPDGVAVSNPLFYSPNKYTSEHNISVPERHEVSSSKDIISANSVRAIEIDDEVEVYLSAIMIKQKLGEKRWISIANFEPTPVNLNGWSLFFNDNEIIINKASTQKMILNPGESLSVKIPASIDIDIEQSGVVQLWNSDKERVDRVNYTIDDIRKVPKGKVLMLLSPRNLLLDPQF